MYLPSRITPRKPAFNSRVAISAARMFSGVSIAGTQAAMFSAGPTLVPARPVRADRLHGEAVRQRDVVADLVQLRRRQFEAGRVDAPAVAEIHEASGFVDREDILDAVAQALRHIAGVIRERLRGVAGLPAADAVLQRLRQIPVIQRRIGLDAVGQQFVDQAVVEVEALWDSARRCLPEIPAARRSKTGRP